MKKWYLIIAFLVCNFSNASIKEDIEQILRANHFKEKNLGLVVANEGKTIFELNSNKLFVPASLTKIVTAGTVLNHFPMNIKFSTEVWSKGKIEKNKLIGDVCLKGGGDPSFVSEKMWFLVNELTREEFDKIDGDLIVDATRFDDELFDTGRESVRVDRAFDAPISAMSFNWNSVNVFVRPGIKAGEFGKVIIDPINTYIELENKVQTGKENSKKTITVDRIKSGDHDKIVVTGTIPLNSSELVFYKGITNPPLWTGHHFMRFLKERGIEISGKIKIGKCENESRKLASVDSKSLNEMIADMLKFSNNFVAEMLIKNVAANLSNGSPAQMKNGLIVAQNFLESIDINKKDYVLENVSGLTRENSFTPSQLLKVLYSLKNDFQVYPEFLAGLPIAGLDGTLKNRFKSKKEQSNNEKEFIVRAKTGYLDGVVGLAGFVGRRHKSPLVFVFIFNGDYEQGLMARKVFDEIIGRVKKWE